MAKKRKIIKKNYLFVFVAFCLGLAATAMIFLPAVKTGSDDYLVYYKGTFVSFGGDLLPLIVLRFNILAVLGYFLPVIGGLSALFAGKMKIVKLVSIACFLGAAILLFLLPSYLQTYNTLLEITSEFSCELAYGAIIGGVLSALAGLISAYDLVK